MLLKEQFTGIQHIGIPAHNLEKSLKFYESLGFECIHKKSILRPEGPIDVVFVQVYNLIIELYEFTGEHLEEVLQRTNGHIDHIAINVLDVQKVYEELKRLDYQILDQEIQFIPFFEKGVRFFTLVGPNGEKLEFNQRC